MTLALYGGTPVRKDPLPPRPSYGNGEREAVNEVITSGELSGFLAEPGAAYRGGRYVQVLEEAWCRQFGVQHAIAMNSATSCLFGAVAALAAPRDEVIVPPWSMSASAAAVLAAGATPIFADIEPDTYGLDARSVRRLLKPQTKAIIVVDLFGCPARDIGQLTTLGVPVIEDAAQAIGAGFGFDGVPGPPPWPSVTWKWVPTGRIAALDGVGVFSLNRHKTLHCGEGGIAVTDNDDYAAFLRGWRNHGEVVNYRQGYVGGNYRMGEIEAAIAEVQLRRLEELTAPRIRNAERLTDVLSAMDGITPPGVPNGFRHVYYLYAFAVQGSAERFAKALTAEGVPATTYVEPLYRLPVFRGHARREDTNKWEEWYPCMERSYDRVVVLPHVHAGMTDRDIDDVIGAIDKVHDYRDQL